MAGASQLQLDPQPRTVSPILREKPTAAGIEEVPLVHQDPIDAEAHFIGPPAEHQSLAGRTGLHPTSWTDQGLLEVQPIATSWPNQQSSLSPIGTVVTPPGIGQYRTPFLIA